MADRNALARQAVVNTLTGAGVHVIKPYTIRGFTLLNINFSVVAVNVSAGVTKVVYDSSEVGMAEYDTGTNTFHLGFTDANSLSRKALIVHESVHAVCDLMNLTTMDIGTSESAAYLAQCLYARGNSTDPDPDARLYSEDEDKDRVFQVGWELAGTLLAGSTPSTADYDRLRDAVNRHPYYRGKAGDSARFNG